MKRETIFQEIIRRLRNTSPDQPWSVSVNTLAEYMNKLRISGYNKRFRFNVLKGAVDRYKTMDKKFKTGVLKRYRSRAEIVYTRSQRVGRSSNTWFIGDKGKYSSTLVIPYTPGSELAKSVREAVKDNIIAGGLTKVVESTGQPVSVGAGASQPRQLQGMKQPWQGLWMSQ